MLIQPDLFLFPALVPEQEFLSGPVPTVYGPIAYREWKSQLERIHEVLRLSGVDETFQRLSLAQRNLAEQQAADKEKRPFYKWSAPKIHRVSALPKFIPLRGRKVQPGVGELQQFNRD